MISSDIEFYPVVMADGIIFIALFLFCTRGCLLFRCIRVIKFHKKIGDPDDLEGEFHSYFILDWCMDSFVSWKFTYPLVDVTNFLVYSEWISMCIHASPSHQFPCGKLITLIEQKKHPSVQNRNSAVNVIYRSISEIILHLSCIRRLQ